MAVGLGCSEAVGAVGGASGSLVGGGGGVGAERRVVRVGSCGLRSRTAVGFAGRPVSPYKPEALHPNHHPPFAIIDCTHAPHKNKNKVSRVVYTGMYRCIYLALPVAARGCRIKRETPAGPRGAPSNVDATCQAGRSVQAPLRLASRDTQFRALASGVKIMKRKKRDGGSPKLTTHA